MDALGGVRRLRRRVKYLSLRDQTQVLAMLLNRVEYDVTTSEIAVRPIAAEIDWGKQRQMWARVSPV